MRAPPASNRVAECPLRGDVRGPAQQGRWWCYESSRNPGQVCAPAARRDLLRCHAPDGRVRIGQQQHGRQRTLVVGACLCLCLCLAREFSPVCRRRCPAHCPGQAHTGQGRERRGERDQGRPRRVKTAATSLATRPRASSGPDKQPEVRAHQPRDRGPKLAASPSASAVASVATALGQVTAAGRTSVCRCGQALPLRGLASPPGARLRRATHAGPEPGPARPCGDLTASGAADESYPVERHRWISRRSPVYPSAAAPRSPAPDPGARSATEVVAMTAVVLDISMSLDGFVTGPRPGVGCRWARAGSGWTTGCSAGPPAPASRQATVRRPTSTVRSPGNCSPPPERC